MASCGPPRSEASARTTRWVARAQPKAQPTSSAPSSPQFSAPCQPHCGSATAPPRFRAPYAIHSISAHAEIVESLLQAAARGFGYRRRLPSGRAGPACPQWANSSLYPNNSRQPQPIFVRDEQGKIIKESLLTKKSASSVTSPKPAEKRRMPCCPNRETTTVSPDRDSDSQCL